MDGGMEGKEAQAAFPFGSFGHLIFQFHAQAFVGRLEMRTRHAAKVVAAEFGVHGGDIGTGIGRVKGLRQKIEVAPGYAKCHRQISRVSLDPRAKAKKETSPVARRTRHSILAFGCLVKCKTTCNSRALSVRHLSAGTHNYTLSQRIGDVCVLLRAFSSLPPTFASASCSDRRRKVHRRGLVLIWHRGRDR